MNDILTSKLNEFKNFSIILKNEAVEISPVLSKDRALIFYKYSNRNGGYITDEFAEKLLSTIPYAPVKGIFSNNDEDFTDHGKARDLGKIYGVVSAIPNISWEDHLDDDGITRTYAAVDVFLYTALYKEAKEINGKSLSMELYEPSLQGSFKLVDGRRQFVYTDGCFLGLQVLGEDTEPCFEGAGFYSLCKPVYDSLKILLDELKSYTLMTENKLIGEEKKMPEINFKLSDNQKYGLIWELVNPNYNEEGGWMMETSVEDVYDDYALCYDYEEHQYYRYYYTKDDSSDSVTLNSKEKCFIVEVNEAEKAALDALHAIKNFENIDTYVQELEDKSSTFEQRETELNEQIAGLNSSIEEKDTTIASLNTSIEEKEAEFTVTQEKLTASEQEVNELKEYKLQKETSEKEEVISKYAEVLSEELINKFREDIANYTNIELEEKLAYEYVKADSSIFSKKPEKKGYVERTAPLSGLEEMLSKYENHNN